VENFDTNGDLCDTENVNHYNDSKRRGSTGDYGRVSEYQKFNSKMQLRTSWIGATNRQAHECCSSTHGTKPLDFASSTIPL